MPKLKTLMSKWLKFDIEYRLHSTRRMFERDISNEDINNLLNNGKIIEHYPDDYPLLSFLLNGYTLDPYMLSLQSMKLKIN